MEGRADGPRFVGDIVLITAGDQVAADGRIIEASALQIDESALTGESVPSAKNTGILPGPLLAPGDRTNMAFMNTPVTHGSGVLVVTATGAATEVGKISGMLSRSCWPTGYVYRAPTTPTP
ncbi:hypothetical protein [Streptomyces sp. NPDC018352]|uniref:P-type ATPase n=1 Tax=Streptomyces sp. NPDC018352 TaxID=3157194 RepID=UPI0033D8BAF1